MRNKEEKKDNTKILVMVALVICSFYAGVILADDGCDRVRQEEYWRGEECFRMLNSSMSETALCRSVLDVCTTGEVSEDCYRVLNAE